MDPPRAVKSSWAYLIHKEVAPFQSPIFLSSVICLDSYVACSITGFCIHINALIIEAVVNKVLNLSLD